MALSVLYGDGKRSKKYQALLNCNSKFRFDKPQAEEATDPGLLVFQVSLDTVGLRKLRCLYELTAPV